MSSGQAGGLGSLGASRLADVSKRVPCLFSAAQSHAGVIAAARAEIGVCNDDRLFVTGLVLEQHFGTGLSKLAFRFVKEKRPSTC
jgi:hypothetical protein